MVIFGVLFCEISDNEIAKVCRSQNLDEKIQSEKIIEICFMYKYVYEIIEYMSQKYRNIHK